MYSTSQVTWEMFQVPDDDVVFVLYVFLFDFDKCSFEVCVFEPSRLIVKYHDPTGLLTQMQSLESIDSDSIPLYLNDLTLKK